MRIKAPQYRIGETVYFIRIWESKRSVVGSRIIYIEWFDSDTKHWHEYHLEQWTSGFMEDQLFATAGAAAEYINDNPLEA